jgi:hypothetical protein
MRKRALQYMLSTKCALPERAPRTPKGWVRYVARATGRTAPNLARFLGEAVTE